MVTPASITDWTTEAVAAVREATSSTTESNSTDETSTTDDSTVPEPTGPPGAATRTAQRWGSLDNPPGTATRTAQRYGAPIVPETTFSNTESDGVATQGTGVNPWIEAAQRSQKRPQGNGGGIDLSAFEGPNISTKGLHSSAEALGLTDSRAPWTAMAQEFKERNIQKWRQGNQEIRKNLRNNDPLGLTATLASRGFRFTTDNPVWSLQEAQENFQKETVAALDPDLADADDVSNARVSRQFRRGWNRIAGASDLTAGAALGIVNPNAAPLRNGKITPATEQPGLTGASSRFLGAAGTDAVGGVSHFLTGTNIATGDKTRLSGNEAIEAAFSLAGGGLTTWTAKKGAKALTRLGGRVGQRGSRELAEQATEAGAREAAESVGQESAETTQRNIGTLQEASVMPSFIDDAVQTGRRATGRQISEGFDWLMSGSRRSADEVADTGARQTEEVSDLPVPVDESELLPRTVTDLDAVDTGVRNAELATVRSGDSPVARMSSGELPGDITDFRAQVLDGTSRFTDEVDTAPARHVNEDVMRNLGPGTQRQVDLMGSVTDIDDTVTGARRVTEQVTDDISATVRQTVDDVTNRGARESDETPSPFSRLGEETTERTAREADDTRVESFGSVTDDTTSRIGREATEETGERTARETAEEAGEEAAEESPGWFRRTFTDAGDSTQTRLIERIPGGGWTVAGATTGILGGLTFALANDSVPGGPQRGSQMPDQVQGDGGWSMEKVKAYPAPPEGKGGAQFTVYNRDGTPMGKAIVLAIDPEGKGQVYTLKGKKNPAVEQANADAQAVGLAAARARRRNRIPGQGTRAAQRAGQGEGR